MKRHMPTCTPKDAKEAKSDEKDPLATAKEELVLQIIAEAKVKKSNIKTMRNSTDDASHRKEEMDLQSVSDAESKPLTVRKGKRKSAKRCPVA